MSSQSTQTIPASGRLYKSVPPLFAIGAGATSIIPQFGSLANQPVVWSDNPDVIAGGPAWPWGWAGAVMNNDAPALEDFNALQYAMTFWLRYLYQMGIPEWSATQSYFSGAFATSNGALFVSLADGNIGNSPAANGDWWNAVWSHFTAPFKSVSGMGVQAVQLFMNDFCDSTASAELVAGGSYSLVLKIGGIGGPVTGNPSRARLFVRNNSGSNISVDLSQLPANAVWTTAPMSTVWSGQVIRMEAEYSTGDGVLYLTQAGVGSGGGGGGDVILTSPNGTTYALVVSDNGLVTPQQI